MRSGAGGVPEAADGEVPETLLEACLGAPQPVEAAYGRLLAKSTGPLGQPLVRLRLLCSAQAVLRAWASTVLQGYQPEAYLGSTSGLLEACNRYAPLSLSCWLSLARVMRDVCYMLATDPFLSTVLCNVLHSTSFSTVQGTSCDGYILCKPQEREIWSLVVQVHVRGAAAPGADERDAAGGRGAPEGLCGGRDGSGGTIRPLWKMTSPTWGIQFCIVLNRRGTRRVVCHEVDSDVEDERKMWEGAHMSDTTECCLHRCRGAPCQVVILVALSRWVSFA